MIPVTPGQGWRLSVQHTTGYRYGKEVAASYNEARLIPRTTPRQLPLGTRVTTSPAGRPIRYVDYWGNQVVAFDVHIPHTELTVTSSAVVETSPPPLAPPEPASWAVLRDPGATDPFTEYLMPRLGPRRTRSWRRLRGLWPPSMTRWTWSWPPATGCGRR